MFRRSVTWVLCLAGILLGSVAWSAWVFLHTWADPTTTERVTEAVLADPAAREEVLEPVHDQIRAAIPQEAGVSDAQIDAALDSVLADPAARDRIADAFVSSTGALRLGDARAAFGDEIVRLQPGLAPVVESSPPALALPDLSFADRARDLAETWVVWLALASIGMFGLSLIFGDPRRTARRFGVWAMSMGLLWVIGPPIAAWLASNTVASLDATVDVVVHEYTRPIRPWALALTIVGALALVASFVPVRGRARTRWPEPAEQSRPPGRVLADAPPSYGPTIGRREPAGPVTYGPTAGRRAEPARSAPVHRSGDTQEMPTQLRPNATTTSTTTTSTTTNATTTDATPPRGPERVAHPSAASTSSAGDETDEIDVWAAYGPS